MARAGATARVHVDDVGRYRSTKLVEVVERAPYSEVLADLCRARIVVIPLQDVDRLVSTELRRCGDLRNKVELRFTPSAERLHAPSKAERIGRPAEQKPIIAADDARQRLGTG